MKQVIFLCLLSLTMCLSNPAEPVSEAVKPVATDAKVDKPTEQTPAAQTAVNVDTPSTPKETASEKPGTHMPNIPPMSTQKAQEEAKGNTPTATDNKTNEKKEDATPSTSTNATKKDETPITPKENFTESSPGMKNQTQPEDKKDAKNDTTTKTPNKPAEIDTKTATPKGDEDKHIVQARGFDGPSFIGGIILTLGLLAIGFMGFKYYKNQTERNYHTL